MGTDAQAALLHGSWWLWRGDVTEDDVYHCDVAALSKKPLQIYLDSKQDQSLRMVAKRSGLSMAELIRRSIDRYLEETLPPDDDPALGLVGLGASGRSDLSEAHDEVLAGRLSGG